MRKAFSATVRAMEIAAGADALRIVVSTEPLLRHPSFGCVRAYAGRSIDDEWGCFLFLRPDGGGIAVAIPGELQDSPRMIGGAVPEQKYDVRFTEHQVDFMCDV